MNIKKDIENTLYRNLEEYSLEWSFAENGSPVLLKNILNNEHCRKQDEFDNLVLGIVNSLFEKESGTDNGCLQVIEDLEYPVYYLGEYACITAMFTRGYDANMFSEMMNDNRTDKEIDEGVEYTTVKSKYDDYPDEYKR